MRFSIMQEYIRLCRMNGWCPTWDGLNEYKHMRDMHKSPKPKK